MTQIGADYWKWKERRIREGKPSLVKETLREVVFNPKEFEETEE